MALAIPDNYNTPEAMLERYKYGQNTASSMETAPNIAYQPGSSDDAFLESVYQNETGRASDAIGKEYWMGQLNEGKSRDDVISAFNQTAEGMGYDAPQQQEPTSPQEPALTLTGAQATGYEPTSYTAAPASSVATYSAPAQAQTQGYTATNQAITPEQLSGDRLTQLLGEDSAYMKQARNQGMLTAHSRGLVNSSIAAGASQAEAIKAGLPIAMQEAGVYSNAASNFANAQNRASEFSAGEENVAALQTNAQQDRANEFGASAQNLSNREHTAAVDQASAFSATALNQAGEFYASAQNTASLQNANNELALALQQAKDEISTYATDVQRDTALDTLGLNLFNTAINTGVFNNPETIAGYFNTVSGLFPELGIEMIAQSSAQVPAGVIV